MIESLRIQNFKSFEVATFPLRRVTFLVGLNGSGKTNLIELLRFANWLAKGGRLDDLKPILGAEDNKIRARMGVELVRRGASSFELDVAVKNGAAFRLHQSFNATQNVQTGVQRLILDEESVKDETGNRQIYDARGDKSRLTDDGIEVLNAKLSRAQALYYQINSPTQFGAGTSGERAYGVTRYVQTALARMFFMTPDFSKLSLYVPRSRGMELEEDGSNLSAVAYRLNSDALLQKEFFDMVRNLPEREFSGIGFSEAAMLDEVMLVLKETSSLPMPLQLLSEGTKRVLMIAAALLTVPEGTLLVFEEIDTGIHPSRVAHLVNQVYRIAERRNLQVLVTTHNTNLLDAIPDREIANVVICHRDVDTGASRLVRFGEIPEYASLVMRGNLGGLMTSEAIEKALRSPITKEERKRRFETLEKATRGDR